MHLVHMKITSDDPLSEPDGLVVVSVLFEQTSKPNKGLKPLVHAFKSMAAAHLSENIESKFP